MRAITRSGGTWFREFIMTQKRPPGENAAAAEYQTEFCAVG